MATLTIRNIDSTVKEKLRVRAARHGHSMEAEMRSILTEALRHSESSAPNLAEAIHRRFAVLGGVDDLELPPHDTVRDPPRFDL